jgi:hypothetical protein
MTETMISSAEPPHHTDNCFGHRIRYNCFFWLDSSPKNIVSQLFLPISHTTLGPDLLVIHTPLTSHSSVSSSRALCQFHSTHSTLAPISTGMGKTWSLHPEGTPWHLGVSISSHSHLRYSYFSLSLSPSSHLAPASLAPGYVG